MSTYGYNGIVNIGGEMNYTTNKHIMAFYPSGAGGKFLLNSLSFANNACVTEDTLTLRQLQGSVTAREKFDFVMEKVNRIDTVWNDFLMSHSVYMFGNDAQQEYNVNVLRFLANHAYLDLDPTKLYLPSRSAQELMRADSHYFFSSTHNFPRLYVFSRIWPNSTFITFKNNAFANRYRKDMVAENSNLDYLYALETSSNYTMYQVVLRLAKKYNQLKGSSWPTFADLMQDPLLLTDHLQTELKQLDWHFLKELLGLPHYAEFYRKLSKNSIEWDTDWYFDRDVTVENIERIYNQIGLTGFNRDFIKDYYDNWIGCVDKLSTVAPEESNSLDHCLTKLQEFTAFGDQVTAAHYLSKIEQIFDTPTEKVDNMSQERYHDYILRKMKEERSEE